MNGAIFICVLFCLVMPSSIATPLLQKFVNFFRDSSSLSDHDKLETPARKQNTTMEILDVTEFKHHNYEQMTWYLKYFALKYPQITKLYSIGYSVQNRKLWAMKISSNPEQHDPGEPELKFVGNIHGNEFVGREMLLRLIKNLCENYDRNGELTKLVDTTGIHILPSLNPDGYELASVKGKENPYIGHRNANGVDINRNFPDQFFPSTTGSPQPETRAAMDWIQSHPFVLSGSLHSGALVASYPYDDSPSGQSLYSATPDDDVFRHLAKSYSQSHPIMHLANPKWTCTDVRQDHFIDGITNGAQWFSISGGMQDYNYVQSNAFEVTLDLGCERAPNASKLRKYWDENRPALIKFIQQVHKGVRGFVKNVKGEPLKDATIRVSDRRHDVTTAKDGDYWRLLVPGSYEVTATAKEYEPQTKLVEIRNDEERLVNFTLRLVNDKENYIESEADFLNTAVGDGIHLTQRGDDPRDHITKAREFSTSFEGSRDGRDAPDMDRSSSSSLHRPSSIPDDEVVRPTPVKYLDLREGLINPKDLANLRNDHPGSSDGSADESSGASNEDNAAKEKASNDGGKEIEHAKNIEQKPNIEDKKIVNTDKKKQSIKTEVKTPVKTTSSKDKAKSLNEAKVDVLKHRPPQVPKQNTEVKAKNKTPKKPTNNAQITNADKKTSKTQVHIKRKSIQSPPANDKHFAKMVGSKIQCHAAGSKMIKEGFLRWVGNLPNLPHDSAHLVAGVELKTADRLGTNGTFRGVRYFMALPKKGYFFKLSDCKTVR